MGDTTDTPQNEVQAPETSTEEQASADTFETAGNDAFNAIFGKTEDEQPENSDGWKPQPTETDEPADTANAEAEEPDTETEEVGVTEDESSEEEAPVEDAEPKTYKVKLDGTEKDVELTDEDIVESYQKSWNYDKKVREVNEKLQHADQLFYSLAFAKQRNDFLALRDNPGAYRDFIAKTEDDFIGLSDKEGAEAEAEERQMWEDHKKSVDEMKGFAKDFKSMQEGFSQIKSSFAEAHPEIENVDQWVLDNLTPYAAPIETGGRLPYQDDTLEMIYHWKNKDKYDAEWQKKVDAAKASGEKEGEKKVAKKKVVKKSESPAVKQGNQSAGEKAFQNVFKSKTPTMDDVFRVVN